MKGRSFFIATGNEFRYLWKDVFSELLKTHLTSFLPMTSKQDNSLFVILKMPRNQPILKK